MPPIERTAPRWDAVLFEFTDKRQRFQNCGRARKIGIGQLKLPLASQVMRILTGTFSTVMPRNFLPMVSSPTAAFPLLAADLDTMYQFVLVMVTSQLAAVQATVVPV